MRVDWGSIDENSRGGILPSGEYLVQVDDIEVKFTSSGAEQWILWLKVLDGPYKGERIRDTINFSPRALPRAKFVLTRLGCPSLTTWECDENDPSSTLHAQYSEFALGLTAFVSVEQSSFTGRDGKEVACNEVPYNGYRMTEKGEERRRMAESEATEDLFGDEKLPF